MENLSLQNIAEGWDGVEQGGADHKNVFLGPRGAAIDVNKMFLLTRVQLAQTPSGLPDRRALPLISDASISFLAHVYFPSVLFLPSVFHAGRCSTCCRRGTPGPRLPHGRSCRALLLGLRAPGPNPGLSNCLHPSQPGTRGMGSQVAS